MTFRSVADAFRLNPSTLAKDYKDKLSDFRTWAQREHATDWILMVDNIGERMCIDETAPSRGDLFTILSNKDGHGKKGSIAATVRGTKSEDLSLVFNKIPESKRLKVKEVTMDFSDSMRMAVETSFPNAEITIDCFHIVQLATSALSEIRMKHKRKAIAEDARRRKEHKQRQKRMLSRTGNAGRSGRPKDAPRHHRGVSQKERTRRTCRQGSTTATLQWNSSRAVAISYPKAGIDGQIHRTNVPRFCSGNIRS